MELIYLNEYNNNNSHNNFYIFLILSIFLYISIFIYILILIISSLQLFEIKIIFLAFLRDIFYFIISKSIFFFFFAESYTLIGTNLINLLVSSNDLKIN